SPSNYNAYDTAGELCYSSSTQPSSYIAQASCGGSSAPTYPSGATNTYSYNQAGGRICTTRPNSSGATCANPNPTYATTYGYDAVGNMDCITPANMLGASCANPDSTASYSYTYNAAGLRMSETPPGGTTQQFVWNSLSTQLLEDGSNAYIYGPAGTPLGTAPLEQISLPVPLS
ncbi:hypothetical protein B1B_08587, partial [mine drainage metagenome]